VKMSLSLLGATLRIVSSEDNQNIVRALDEGLSAENRNLR
jgi:hypothetical protein